MDRPVDTVADVLIFLKEGDFRLHRTAIHRMLSPDSPEEMPITLFEATLEERAAELLLREPGISPSSVVSYRARARTALKIYREAKGVPPPVAEAQRPVPRTESRKRAMRQELDEALRKVGEWPHLQAYLLPALLEAMQAISAVPKDFTGQSRPGAGRVVSIKASSRSVQNTTTAGPTAVVEVSASEAEEVRYAAARR